MLKDGGFVIAAIPAILCSLLRNSRGFLFSFLDFRLIENLPVCSSCDERGVGSSWTRDKFRGSY